MMRAPSRTRARTMCGFQRSLQMTKPARPMGVSNARSFFSDSIETPGGVGAFGQLDLVIAAADVALLVEEDGAVKGFIADAFGEAEGKAGVEGAGQFPEAEDVGAVDWFGYIEHGDGRSAALDDFHHNVTFERALGGQDHAGVFLGGLDEQLLHAVSVGDFVPLDRAI